MINNYFPPRYGRRLELVVGRERMFGMEGSVLSCGHWSPVLIEVNKMAPCFECVDPSVPFDPGLEAHWLLLAVHCYEKEAFEIKPAAVELEAMGLVKLGSRCACLLSTAQFLRMWAWKLTLPRKRADLMVDDITALGSFWFTLLKKAKKDHALRSGVIRRSRAYESGHCADQYAAPRVNGADVDAVHDYWPSSLEEREMAFSGGGELWDVWFWCKRKGSYYPLGRVVPPRWDVFVLPVHSNVLIPRLPKEKSRD